MRELSDRTIAERLAGRLRAAQVFQLFLRRLGPTQPVHVASMGFLQSGRMYRVEGKAGDFALALVVMLETADRGPITTETREALALLQRRLASARVFQLFARRLGPFDVVYVSALCLGVDDKIVEAKASAMKLEHALVQLLANVDHATTTEE